MATSKRWRRVRGGALFLVAAVLLLFSSTVVAEGVRWLRIAGFEGSPPDRTTIRYEGQRRVMLGAVVGLPAFGLLFFAVRDLRARGGTAGG